MLGLLKLLLLTVNQAEAYQVKRVGEQHRLGLLIERARAAQRGANVHFEEPWTQFGVNEHIKAVDFKARIFVQISRNLFSLFQDSQGQVSEPFQRWI